MKNDMARTIAAAMALFAFMPLAAAVPVNEGLFFDLGYKGDLNGDGKIDRGEIGNLMTIGRAEGVSPRQLLCHRFVWPEQALRLS
jgi:hypothetical protein